MSAFYYEITEKSPRFKEYFDYKEADAKQQEAIKKFFKEQGISAEKYAIGGGKLWLEDTKENEEAFGLQLGAASKNGAVPFKKNSAIGKAFAKSGILDIHAEQPFVPFFFDGLMGRMRTRLFEFKGKVYCSVETIEYDCKCSAPEGFVEMKASDFHKILEEIEEINNKK